jgi:hypothetical protein
MDNLAELPRRVGLRVFRIAFNAWGGVVKADAIAHVKKISGFLSRSLTVKIKIPDASYNVNHHGRPAYGMVGPNRRAVKAQARIDGKDKFLSVRKATKRVLSGGKVRAYKPSRYAHFVERGIAGKAHTPPNPFIAMAEKTGETRGMAAFANKLATGIAAEAAKLPK